MGRDMQLTATGEVNYVRHSLTAVLLSQLAKGLWTKRRLTRQTPWRLAEREIDKAGGCLLRGGRGIPSGAGVRPAV
jgi:hypothetical protein